ncbi:hypothetical protein BDV95DRAFT_661723, partial [Massariosphaeria phaeospora]
LLPGNRAAPALVYILRSLASYYYSSTPHLAPRPRTVSNSRLIAIIFLFFHQPTNKNSQSQSPLIMPPRASKGSRLTYITVESTRFIVHANALTHYCLTWRSLDSPMRATTACIFRGFYYWVYTGLLPPEQITRSYPHPPSWTHGTEDFPVGCSMAIALYHFGWRLGVLDLINDAMHFLFKEYTTMDRAPSTERVLHMFENPEGWELYSFCADVHWRLGRLLKFSWVDVDMDRYPERCLRMVLARCNWSRGQVDVDLGLRLEDYLLLPSPQERTVEISCVFEVERAHHGSNPYPSLSPSSYIRPSIHTFNRHGPKSRSNRPNIAQQHASFSSGGWSSSGQNGQQSNGSQYMIQGPLSAGPGTPDTAFFYHTDDERRKRDMRRELPFHLTSKQLIEIADRIEDNIKSGFSDPPAQAREIVELFERLSQILREIAIARDRNQGLSLHKYKEIALVIMSVSMACHEHTVGNWILSEKDAGQLWQMQQNAVRVVSLSETNQALSTLLAICSSYQDTERQANKSQMTPQTLHQEAWLISLAVKDQEYLPKDWFSKEEDVFLLSLSSRMRHIAETKDAGVVNRRYNRRDPVAPGLGNNTFRLRSVQGLLAV